MKTMSEGWFNHDEKHANLTGYIYVDRSVVSYIPVVTKVINTWKDPVSPIMLN